MSQILSGFGIGGYKPRTGANLMTKAKVLLEPVSADRIYLAGEELDLPEHDAKMLERFGIVSIQEDEPPKAKSKAKTKDADPDPEA
jgi:hypothetical protein